MLRDAPGNPEHPGQFGKPRILHLFWGSQVFSLIFKGVNTSKIMYSTQCFQNT